MSNDAQEQELGAEVVTSAGASDDGLDSMRNKFENLCRDLNMDRKTEVEAFRMLNEVLHTYSLEGEIAHWFCCALFAASRQSTTPTVGGQGTVVMGNCVPLNNLLRSCQMSIYEFTPKIKSWCDMANLPEEFSQQMEELKRKFYITFTLNKQYRKIFEQVFLCPAYEKNHSKFNSSPKCSFVKLDDICWRLFLCSKNQKPTLTLDLVTSYNLMMCCIDLIFANVLAEMRTDLINPNFEGLPANWNTPQFDQTQVQNHCILNYFCEMTDEAKTMKATVFKEIMHSFFKSNTIFGNEDTLLDLVSNQNFERNLRSLNISYEQYVLSVGEFDERIIASYPLDAVEHGNLNEQAIRPPVTPLTRKQDLPPQSVMSEQKFEPVSHATNNVKKLSAAVSDITEPTEFVKQAGEDHIKKILMIVEQMGNKFLAKYPMRSEAENRFRLSKSLYFYLMDLILRAEVKNKPQIMHRISLERLHVALMTCCTELVLDAYDTELKFPWILKCFSINAFEFFKIIEIVVRHGKDFLTRSSVKHLNSIEETCLERLAWQRNSPAWEMINSPPNPLPPYSEVLKATAAGPLEIFLRKIYQLGWTRILTLCNDLNLGEKKKDLAEKIWTIFEYSITNRIHLMQDRHLDQIIMCAIYIYIKLTQMLEPTFSMIMQAYRNQPQAVNSVYREVLISVKETGERVYNDIIHFYNYKYVPEMREFCHNRINANTDNKQNLLLSPHPIERTTVPKKLTHNHSLYVAKMSKNEIKHSPDQCVYVINSSPAKLGGSLTKKSHPTYPFLGQRLEAMNKKMKSNGKRMLSFGDDDTKRRKCDQTPDLSQL